MKSLTLGLALAAALVLPRAGLAAMHDHEAMAKGASAPKTIEITLSDEGMTPREVKVMKGEALRLAITRKTDHTCATELVVQEYGIKQPLPLNKTVMVDLTPKASGKIKLLCGMGMTISTLVVQ